MKKLLYGMLAFLTIAGIQSCSTSNDVVSNGLLQKRKFNKGYHYAGLAKGAEKASKLNNSTAVTTVNEVKTNTPLLQASIKNTPSAAIANRTPTKTIAPNVFESNATTSTLSKKQVKKEVKQVVKQVKQMKVKSQKENNMPSDDKLLYIILAILIPFVAVGLVTDWDITQVLIAFLLTWLCWIPGIIYAIMKVNDNM